MGGGTDVEQGGRLALGYDFPAKPELGSGIWPHLFRFPKTPLMTKCALTPDHPQITPGLTPDHPWTDPRSPLD